MRIAICVNAFWPLVGGAEVVTKKIAEFLDEKHDVFVIKS